MVVSNRKPEKIIIVIISIVFIIWSAIFIYKSSFIAVDNQRYFCLFDDAMISMRYAWNFSHGLGLVWNPGELVEGYTNLLMVLLMSLATLIFDKSIAVLFIQILGAGFMLVIAFLSMNISDHIFQNESDQQRAFIRLLSFFCALSYYPLAYWSLMGMETGLLTLLLLLGILSAFNYTKHKKPAHLSSTALYLGLAYLTRNDSLIFSVLIWAYLLWEASRQKSDRKNLRQLFATFGIFLLYVFGQSLFRYLYYGELLPNTYTLKLTGIPLLIRLQGGIGFIAPFLKITAPILILPILGLILNFRKQNLLLLSIVFSTIAYQIYVGGDPWNYWRIMSPSIPLAMILFIISINVILDAIVSTRAFRTHLLREPIFSGKIFTTPLATLLILAGLISANAGFWGEISFQRKPYQIDANRENVNTAIVLNQLTTENASVGVFWAGTIPYYTGLRAIDFLGKSDEYIASLPADISGNVSWSGMQSVPGHNKYDLNYSISILEPTYVQTFQWGSFVWGSQNLSQWAETRYVQVVYDGISLYLLKDSPAVLWDQIDTP